MSLSWNFPARASPSYEGSDTLIRFGKFEEITVLMEKRVTLTQTQVISTQWTLKRPKKLLKAKFFFKGQI